MVIGEDIDIKMSKRISSNKRLKLFSIFAILIVFTFAVYIFSDDTQNDSNIIDTNTQNSNETEELIDYNDYKYLVEQFVRKGDGEQGSPLYLEDEQEIQRNDQLYEKTGFYVVVSDKISVNRSIPDLRSPECREQKYSSNLPKVSIIIIFYNEVFSVLKRTLHGIWNRTPQKLLHEIILINDASTEIELYGELEKYVNTNFGNKVKIKNLKKRSGLIVAQMEGARLATGEVLVFFDSHVEVGYNYLPPLIAPIKENRRIATVPLVDDFSSKTFEYIGMQPTRGVIDWMWLFHEIKHELEDPVEPYSTPIMLGCAFAIDRKFFLHELRGFDEKLENWNGENYELSFKLHLCADGLFKVPCSRIAHTFRDINPSRKWQYDFVAKNFKRVAEVWLDDYKNILYSRDPNRYENVDPGDLTLPRKIHQDLKCKPFSYFLKVVAPDMAERYPAFYQVPVFASGTLESSVNGSKLCLYGENVPFVNLELRDCDENSIEPNSHQHFILSFHKQIMLKNTELCVDKADKSLHDCHYEGGNQHWEYFDSIGVIANFNNNKTVCLTADHENRTISFSKCIKNDFYQRWEFGYINETAMEQWDEIDGYKNI